MIILLYFCIGLGSAENCRYFTLTFTQKTIHTVLIYSQIECRIPLIRDFDYMIDSFFIYSYDSISDDL